MELGDIARVLIWPYAMVITCALTICLIRLMNR